MGAAALPIIGTVVGVAGTAASISQQNSAASAQKAGLKAQSEAALKNTQLQLIELERQRLFSQFSSQIEEVARRQERAFQMQDIYLQQKELEQTAMIGDLQTQTAQTTADIEYGQQQQKFDEAEIQSLLGGQRSLSDLQSQYGDAILGANQGLAQAEGQAAGTINQLYQQLKQANLQQTGQFDSLGTAKSQMVQKGETGQLSSSDRALLSNTTGDIAEAYQGDRAQAANQLDLTNIDANLAGSLRDYLVNRADTTKGMSAQQLEQAQLSQERMRRQQQLAATIQYGLQKSSLSLEQIMQTAGVTEQLNALRLLDKAATNRFMLESTQGELNKQFYDTALSAQKVSAAVAGGAEVASLNAQRRAVQGGNMSSLLGSLTKGGAEIYSALNQPQQPIIQQPTNFGFFNPGTASYSGTSSLPSFGSYAPSYNSGAYNYSMGTTPVFGVR